MILCVGEILADMIGSQSDGTFFYERKAGGAPFNVACAIKKFGGSSAFAGSVGDDLIGDFLVGFAKSRELDFLKIDKLKDRNTTLAFVQIDEGGERSFCFYRRNTADYFLPELDNSALEKTDIVNIGSLMLSEDCGFDYAVNLAKRVRSLGKKVAFDVNFRTDIFKNRDEAKKRYEAMLGLADIVKFSEEEIGIFGESYLKEKLNGKLLCISLGENGSEWRFDGNAGRVSTVKVRPVDTTGAGDAFFAGVLKGLDGTDRNEWTAEFLNRVFKEANVCGALNTLGRGAIDFLPDREKIEKTLKNIPL